MQTDPDVNCSAPASRLYDKKNSNDAIETTLITKYNDLNQYPADLRGVLAVNDSGKIEYIPVLLTERGHSRGDSCEAKPFRIKFVKEEIAQAIAQQ